MTSGFRTPWRAVAAMFVLNGALFGIWASRIPAVAARHDLSAGGLGLLLLLLAAGAIVAFPVAGWAADRAGAHRVTLRIGVIYTVALCLIALSGSVWAVAAALFFFGATHGAMDVAMNTWAGEVERRLRRPVMSSFHAMFSLGAGIGAASGFLAARAGLDVQAHFLSASIGVAIVTYAFGGIDWTPDPARKVDAAPIFQVPRGPLFLVGAIAFCSALGEGAMADWSAVFLIETARVDEAMAALGYSAFSVAMVVMRLLGDQVIQRFGPIRTARVAGSIAVLGVLMAVGFGSFPMVICGFVLLGFGYAVIMPLAFSRGANDPVLPPGQAIAQVSTLGYGGLLLGPPVIGFATELTSIRVAFLILAGLSVLIVLLAPVLRAGVAADAQAAE